MDSEQQSTFTPPSFTPDLGSTAQVLRRHIHDGVETENLTESSLKLSDVTTNNASSTKHGFLPKLSGSSTDVLKGDGTFGTITSGLSLLTRKVLTPDATTLTTDTFTAKHYLYVRISQPGSNSVKLAIRFNSDGGNNYSWKCMRNNSAPTNAATQAYIILDDNQNSNEKYFDVMITNLQSHHKPVFIQGLIDAAGSLNDIVNCRGVWTNTSNQITSITLMSEAGTQNLGVDTEIAVFGSD